MIQYDIKFVLKNYVHVGECDVNIDKTVNVWDDTYSISQWKEEYYLVKFYSDGNYGKVRISKQQAHELIGKLNLVDEKSPVFNSGRTWKQVS